MLNSNQRTMNVLSNVVLCTSNILISHFIISTLLFVADCTYGTLWIHERLNKVFVGLQLWWHGYPRAERRLWASELWMRRRTNCSASPVRTKGTRCISANSYQHLTTRMTRNRYTIPYIATPLEMKRNRYRGTRLSV